MRVCFVCNEYPPAPHGGIGTFTQVLSRALVEEGHHVRVIGMYNRGHSAPGYEEDRGVQITRMETSGVRGSGIAARYRLFRALAGWVRRGEIDLVEVPDYQGWSAGWPRLPVPVATRLHGSASYFAAELGSSIGRRTYWVERASVRRADYWCSTSVYTARKTRVLFDLEAPPASIIHNSVEISEDELPFPSRSRSRVVYTGSLLVKKGVVSLIDAWPGVLAVHPRAELHLFGADGMDESGGSMQAYLESTLNPEARSSLTFHGHVSRSELGRALRSARLAVFPSYAEAFAIAPLEAMAHGCPTIYTRRGSGPELIEDGRDGLLVDPDNSPEITRAILELLGSDELAERIGDEGRSRVREAFAIQDLVHVNVAFYEKLLDDYSAGVSRGSTA